MQRETERQCKERMRFAKSVRRDRETERQRDRESGHI